MGHAHSRNLISIPPSGLAQYHRRNVRSAHVRPSSYDPLQSPGLAPASIDALAYRPRPLLPYRSDQCTAS